MIRTRGSRIFAALGSRSVSVILSAMVLSSGACGPTSFSQQVRDEGETGRTRDLGDTTPQGAVTITAPEVFTRGARMPITGRALGDVVSVEIQCDGWFIGHPAVDAHGNYHYDYAFHETGLSRQLRVVGFDTHDRFVAEASTRVDVVAGAAPSIGLTVPTNLRVGTPAHFEGTATGVARVAVAVDGWNVANLPVSGGRFAFDYTFSNEGYDRQVVATGYDVEDRAVAQAVERVDVAGLPASPTLSLDIPGSATVGVAVPFSGAATGGIVRVRVSVDGWQIADRAVSEGGYSLTYAFSEAGTGRAVLAEGLNDVSLVVAQASGVITVAQAVSSSVTVSAPSSVNVGTSTTISGSASSDITRVVVRVDGWQIADKAPSGGGYSFSYAFTSAGNGREIVASGYDGANQLRATATRNINVVSPTPPGGTIPNVPYFYQYNNSINPGGSCQNTSMAMVLKYYGASSVTPDGISSYYGTSQAQTVSGFQSVFNSEAAYFGLSVRDAGTATGSVTKVRNLLAAGIPVVVHGYFTSYGHVIVLLGFDGTDYIAHDPAGRWNQIYKGGYTSWSSTAGNRVRYSRAALEYAIAPDGYVWMHELYNF